MSRAGPLDDDGHDRDPTPVAPWRARNQARFDRLQFRFRVAITFSFAVACVLLPSLGDRRLVVAAVLAGIVLPGHYLVRHLAGVPNPTGWLDLLAVASASVLAAIEPGIWAPALLFQMLNVGGAIAYLQREWVVRLIAASVPPMALSAWLNDVSGSLPMLIVAGLFLPPMLVGSTRKRARQMQAADRLHATLESLPVVLWEADAETGRILSTNGRLERLFGRTRDELDARGMLTDVHDDDLDAVRSRFGGRRSGARSIDYRYRRPDGSTVWLRDRISYTETSHGWVVRGVSIDMTDAREQEMTLERHAHIVERMAATTITLVLDDAGVRRVGHVVDAIEWGLESTLTEPVDVALPEFTGWADFARVLAAGAGERLPARRFADRFGRERFVELEVFPLPGDAIAIVITDVTAREVAAELVRHQATHDDLTGLSNRAALLQHLDEALAGDVDLALLLVDLNEFKEVNDTLGHLSGDEYLRVLGRRLSALTNRRRFVARLGGDEFAVVLHRPDGTLVDDTAEAIAAACREPVFVFGSAIASGASIGVAHSPADAVDAEALLRRADVAMYEAKRHRTPVWNFEPRLERDAGQLELLGQLGDAFDQAQFAMWFQPLVSLTTGEITGAEALVRWDHPALGVLPPARFLDLLTVSGRSADLAQVAVERTAAVARLLPDDISVSVNLTSQNIRDPRLPGVLRAALVEHGVAPNRFVLEITEQHVLDASGVVRATVEELVASGFAVAIDDFGTGYASLVHLRSLPISQLKLDRQFVGSMTRDPDDLAVVRSMILLGHDLGLTITAEGVEDRATAEALAELGCDQAQGYLWSRPAPFETSPLAGCATLP